MALRVFPVFAVAFLFMGAAAVLSDGSEASAPDLVYDLGSFFGTTSSPPEVVTWSGHGSDPKYAILEIYTNAFNRGTLSVDTSMAPSWWTVDVSGSKIVWTIRYGAVSDGDYAIVLSDGGFVTRVTAHITVSDSGSVVPDPSASKFVFRFDTAGGDPIPDKVFSSVTDESYVLDLGTVVPVREGYVFIGWLWNGATVSSVTCSAGSVVVLKAQWEKVSPEPPSVVIPTVWDGISELLGNAYVWAFLLAAGGGAALISRRRRSRAWGRY